MVFELISKAVVKVCEPYLIFGVNPFIMGVLAQVAVWFYAQVLFGTYIWLNLI